MAFKVGIVGLGTMGSMALWQLASRGVDAVGFEQFDLAHQNGAFSGETRMFRTAYSNGAHWAPALIAARHLWQDLERESGMTLLDLNGFASIAPPGTEALERLMSAAAKAGLDVERLEPQEAQRRFPALGVTAADMTILDRAGGLIKPERAVRAALERATGLGARILSQCRVIGIEPRQRGVVVVTEQDRHELDAVIVTTGAWASAFLGRDMVTPHRVALHWYLAKTPDRFGPDLFPPHIRYAGGRSICLFSSQDNTMVKAAIGGSLGVLAEPSDARDAPAWERQELSKAIARHYPDLWPEPVRSESYADGFTPDGDAVIGALRGLPQVVVAAGFSAHGFKIAPIVGAALAEIAQGGDMTQPLGHLRLDRYQPSPPGPHAGRLAC